MNLQHIKLDKNFIYNRNSKYYRVAVN